MYSDLQGKCMGGFCLKIAWCIMCNALRIYCPFLLQFLFTGDSPQKACILTNRARRPALHAGTCRRPTGRQLEYIFWAMRGSIHFRFHFPSFSKRWIPLLLPSSPHRKWERTPWSSLPSPSTSSTCLLSAGKLQPKKKFNQRSEKMQKPRNAVQQDQIIKVQSLSKVKDLDFLLKGYR